MDDFPFYQSDSLTQCLYFYSSMIFGYFVKTIEVGGISRSCRDYVSMYIRIPCGGLLSMFVTC